MEISNDLIFSILKEKNLPFETIINIINKITKNYSTEEFLLFISNNCDAISNSCKKEKIKINLAKLFPQKRKIGDINKILLYIKKILDYQANKNNEFLEFNEEFLKENIIGKKINSGMIMKEELNEIYIKNYFLLLKTFSNYKCNNIYNCLNFLCYKVKLPLELKNEKFIQFINDEYSIIQYYNIDIFYIISHQIGLENINDKFLEHLGLILIIINQFFLIYLI